jgi:hypothetical protein
MFYIVKLHLKVKKNKFELIKHYKRLYKLLLKLASLLKIGDLLFFFKMKSKYSTGYLTKIISNNQ